MSLLLLMLLLLLLVQHLLRLDILPLCEGDRSSLHR